LIWDTNMPKAIVLYDACVLYPAPLRDLLMHLAMTDLYHAKWSNKIHDEWIRNVLKDRPDLKPFQLERTRDLMNSHIRDCMVENFEHLIPALYLPDPDDRHVLAAAAHCNASIILTYNLKDFPAKYLKSFNIEAKHPDAFLMNLLDLGPDEVCGAIKRLRANLKKPPIDVETYLQILEKQELTKSVKMLEPLSALL